MPSHIFVQTCRVERKSCFNTQWTSWTEDPPVQNMFGQELDGDKGEFRKGRDHHHLGKIPTFLRRKSTEEIIHKGIFPETEFPK
eukprot:2676219-Amphidinium_carterae.1